LENYANEDTIQILLENGADKSIMDVHGKTAYDYALENENDEFAYLLKP
jgi:ankyrin repeat protein